MKSGLKYFLPAWILLGSIISSTAFGAVITLNPSDAGTIRDGIGGPFDGIPDAYSPGLSGQATLSTIEDQFFAEFDITGLVGITSAILIYDLRNGTSPSVKTVDIYRYDAAGLTRPVTSLSIADDRWDDLLPGDSYSGTSPALSGSMTGTYMLDVSGLLSPTYTGFRFQDVTLISGSARQLFVDGVRLQVTTVPIPPALWLFGSALGVMGVMRRKP